MRPVWLSLISVAAMALAACGGGDAPAPTQPDAASTDVVEIAEAALQVRILDCGTIEVSDLDVFSTAGDYAGQSDTFTDTCWLIEHPKGRLMWDLGLPGILTQGEPQQNGVFTVSLETTLTKQLEDLDLSPGDIDFMSISHSHFDHIGQADQLTTAKWLVHEDEYNAMFPPEQVPTADGSEADAPPDQSAQFAMFNAYERESFTGEKDVFGDGSVIIFPTPGHTPGHTALQVNLPETGPILLTGDLYHRTESRELGRVPRFNFDEAMTAASISAFETRANDLGAKVIIQHERDDIDALPRLLK